MDNNYGRAAEGSINECSMCGGTGVIVVEMPVKTHMEMWTSSFINTEPCDCRGTGKDAQYKIKEQPI